MQLFSVVVLLLSLAAGLAVCLLLALVCLCRPLGVFFGMIDEAGQQKIRLNPPNGLNVNVWTS
jgi:hypothetical protein